MSSVDDWIKTQQQTFGTLGINPDWLKPSESEDFDLNSLVPTKEVWQCILETRKGVLYDGIGFER